MGGGLVRFSGRRVHVAFLRGGTCGSVGSAGGLVRREVAIGFKLLLPGLGFSKRSCSGRLSSVLPLLSFLCSLIMRVPADEVVRL